MPIFGCKNNMDGNVEVTRRHFQNYVLGGETLQSSSGKMLRLEEKIGLVYTVDLCDPSRVGSWDVPLPVVFDRPAGPLHPSRVHPGGELPTRLRFADGQSHLGSGASRVWWGRVYRSRTTKNFHIYDNRAIDSGDICHTMENVARRSFMVWNAYPYSLDQGDLR